jgi:subtilase family serine protease
MKFPRLGYLALALAAMIGGGSASYAQSQEAIEHSGRTFHQAVCSRAIGRGEARCFAHVVTDELGNRLKGKPDGAAPQVTPSGFGPASLRSAYAITGSGNSSSVIAVVDAYGYANAEADLATYRAQYGLPPCTTANGCFIKRDQRGGTAYARGNTGWAQEQALDLDMVSAMCPGCKILLVQADTPSFANLAAAVNYASTYAGVKAISNSYGGGEAGSAAYNSAYSHAGIAITASTGDSGFGASFPATSPTVIAVGGTRLVAAGNARGWNETAWTSGGSGCSAVYAKPLWQTDGGCPNRMEADVSAVADPATGVAVYGPTGQGPKSGWLVFGGTSASAPIIGGIYGVAGHGASNASMFWSTPGSLNDITGGSNGTCSVSYFCNAGTGYDGPTGNGTPIGIGAF